MNLILLCNDTNKMAPMALEHVLHAALVNDDNEAREAERAVAASPLC